MFRYNDLTSCLYDQTLINESFLGFQYGLLLILNFNLTL